MGEKENKIQKIPLNNKNFQKTPEQGKRKLFMLKIGRRLIQVLVQNLVTPWAVGD